MEQGGDTIHPTADRANYVGRFCCESSQNRFARSKLGCKACVLQTSIGL